MARTVLDQMAAAVEETLKARGPLYHMSNEEADEKLKAMERKWCGFNEEVECNEYCRYFKTCTRSYYKRDQTAVDVPKYGRTHRGPDGECV